MYSGGMQGVIPGVVPKPCASQELVTDIVVVAAKANHKCGTPSSGPLFVPPVSHFVRLQFFYGALGSHPFFPSHVASGRCILSAAAAGAPAGVISTFTEPNSWCAGAVLVVAGAVCALAVHSSWRTEVAVVAGVV